MTKTIENIGNILFVLVLFIFQDNGVGHVLAKLTGQEVGAWQMLTLADKGRGGFENDDIG